MSTDTYWRIIGNDQKFYDLDLLEAEAQLRMIASDATTIDCDITRTVGRIIVNTPFTIEVK
tara:strand:- start:496 stop:678 length:183 start_codon:yes stop_codon:yes gene_type:complete